MKVLISAGGTGGHINPCLDIGRYILEQNDANEVLFIGADGTMDKKLYSASNMNYKLYKSGGLDRKNLLKNFSILSKNMKAYRDIMKAVEEFKPDIGISGGGYISAMAMMCLKNKKIPFIVYEQNAIPGLATKFLSRYATKYAYAFGGVEKMLKYPERGVYTGNPVRKEFFECDCDKAKIKLGFSSTDKVVLCFGGSLGAQKINETIIEMIPRIAQTDIKLVVGTGKFYYKRYENLISKYPNVIIKEYIDDMPLWLNACDVAVTRAGAITLSELCAIRKPAVLIPSPNVTANHQEKNADRLVKAGGAVKIIENDLDTDKLFEILKKLTEDKEKLKEMSDSLEPLCITNSAERIYGILSSIH